MNIRSLAPLVVLWAVTILGCGGNGPSNFKLSGTVTYQGAPVPEGEIFLRPASGPGGFALIKDGEYETIKGRGFEGGISRITFHGYRASGSGTEESAKFAGDLFPPYTVELELPSEDFVYNVEIPPGNRR